MTSQNIPKPPKKTQTTSQAERRFLSASFSPSVEKWLPGLQVSSSS